MEHLTRSEMLVVILASALVVGVLAYQTIRNWLSTPPLSDPWDEEVEKSLHEPEATPVCHRCFTPHPKESWLCPQCGVAVGDYNSLMPNLSALSVGEIARNGVTDRFRNPVFVLIGYVALWFYSGVMFVFIMPFFLHRFFQNLQRVRPEMPDSDIQSDSE